MRRPADRRMGVGFSFLALFHPTETSETIMGNKDMRKEKKKPKQPKEKPKASGSGSSGGMRPAK